MTDNSFSARSIRNALSKILADPRLGWGVLLLVSQAPLLLHIGYGHDFIMHYQRRTLTGEYGVSTWLPYYGYWFIFPFAVLPPPFSLVVWNIANAIGLGVLARYWKVNLLLPALSFPVLYMFGNGQIAGLMAFGVYLGLAANLWLAGLGLVILSIKPQITLLVAVYILWRRFHWKLLVVPLLIFAASLAYWGFWLPEWFSALKNASGGLSGTAWNASGFPWGILALPALWKFRRTPQAWLAMQPLIVPYYAIYSLALPFMAGISWWVWLLGWAVTLIYVRGGYTPLWAVVVLGLLWQLFRRNETADASSLVQD